MKTALFLTFATFILATFNLSAATLYVSLDSPNPSPPYTNWATAAHLIQDAVDAAKDVDTVLVTNGVYAVGGREVSVWRADWGEFQSMGLSRVVVTNAIRLETVNGPLVTRIDGGKMLDERGLPTNGVRCVFLGSNAVLSGFTLMNGVTEYGGGVYCEASAIATNCTLTGNVAIGMGAVGGGAFDGTLDNCTLIGNSAIGWRGAFGGGACGGILNNCTLSGNSATAHGEPEDCGGGGASRSTLNNCTLTGNFVNGYGGGARESVLYNCKVADNWAWTGGGAYGGTLYNCTLTRNVGGSDGVFYNCTVVDNEGGIWGTGFNSIVYYNSGGNYAEGTVLNSCCTTPLPTNGVGNITGPPLFMDLAAGDLRLWEGSPCIDKGANLLGLAFTNLWGEIEVYGGDSTDILGNTRFIDGNGDGIVAWDIGAYEFNSFKPPRFIGSPQRIADGWKLTITGEPNKWTRVQRSGNLKDWDSIWSGSMPADGIKQVTDYQTNQMMFYRAVVP